jgi:predicted nucleic acid-binding protein
VEEVIFVDTSAWYAAYVPSDPRHLAVSRLLRSGDKSFFTSDFVIDETMTLLLVRGERRRAIKFGMDLLITGVVRVELLTLPDLLNAYQVFTKFVDKNWSFTDCSSLVLMQRLRAPEALSLDKDFQQMPGIHVVPLLA